MNPAILTARLWWALFLLSGFLFGWAAQSGWLKLVMAADPIAACIALYACYFLASVRIGIAADVAAVYRDPVSTRRSLPAEPEYATTLLLCGAAFLAIGLHGQLLAYAAAACCVGLSLQLSLFLE